MQNQQNIVDSLKAVILQLSTPADRRDGMVAVKRLENARWLPDEFARVVQKSGNFAFDEHGGLIFTGRGRKLESAHDLVDAYMKIADPAGESRPNNGFFSTHDACNYVTDQLAKRGVTLAPRSVRRHIRDNGEVPAVKVNPRSLVYRQEDLDAFVEAFAANPQGRGRPVGWRKVREV